MVKLVMTKRAARHAGEIGLFVDTEVFEEELAAIKMDTEVEVDAKTKRSLKQHKFIWALATKVAEACDFLDTKDDAYTYMLIEAKHARFIYDHRRDISYAIPKATNWGAMDGTAFTKLAKRITHVVGTHIVPGIDNDALRAEIEAMLNPDLIPTDNRPEPPPITEIPDGPGIGHNSGPAGVSRVDTRRRCGVCNKVLDFPDDPSSMNCGGDCFGCVQAAENLPRPGPAEPVGQGALAAPATDDRAPDPDPSPEPPEARETASARDPVTWTVDMPGDPNWAAGDMPGDAGMYHAYARHHIDAAGGNSAAREWLGTDIQWQLRANLRVQLGVRKQLERYCAEKHGENT